MAKEEIPNAWAEQIFKMLIYMGINPHTSLQTNLIVKTEDESLARVSIALGGETAKVAIVTDGDTWENLPEDWFVKYVPLGTLRVLADVIQPMELAVFEAKRRRDKRAANKATSKISDALYDYIAASGLPLPEKEHMIRRDDGTEVTTIDIAWPDLKLAFYVDGIWWHQELEGMDAFARVAEAGDDPEKMKMIRNEAKSRFERDARNRSELTASGWTVLNCTDRDLYDDDGMQRQVDLLKQVVDREVSRTRNQHALMQLLEAKAISGDSPDGANEKVKPDYDSLMKDVFGS